MGGVRVRKIVTCAECHRDRAHRARGLCSGCYQRSRRTVRGTASRSLPGQVNRFDWVVVERLMRGEHVTVHPDERDATARELLNRGMPNHQVGEVCGMSRDTLREVAA